MNRTVSLGFSGCVDESVWHPMSAGMSRRTRVHDEKERFIKGRKAIVLRVARRKTSR
jgi:hypothetical protein